MAGTIITVRIEDLGVLEKLTAIYARTQDLRPALALVGQIVLESIRRNFRERCSPDGDPWRPVSPAYARWKSSIGKDPRNILILNTHLMNSIISRPRHNSLSIIANVVYAGIHQFGMSSRRMPARPFLGVRREDWGRISEALEEYIVSGNV